jgi:hypothetical protein
LKQIFILAATKQEAFRLAERNGLEDITYINSPYPIRAMSNTQLIIIKDWQRTRCKLQQAALEAVILIYKLRNEVIYDK